jgi:alkylation response protein AidB-like acyl-CoA dehydrogenase
MLADMAVEIGAAKSFLYRAAWQAQNGSLSPKTSHALVAAVKLHSSETAGRVVDRAVQIHGGRGYMREYAVERLYRELRVDRIWEGTSEIQRAIVGNELRKRGPDAFTGWPE